MDSILEEARKSLRAGQDSVLVSIIKTEGSTPGKTGAKMLVGSNGRIYGTIGGGDLELYCIKAAADVFRTGASYTKEFKLDASKTDIVSMICGGDVTVEFRFIDRATDERSLENILGFTVKRPRVLIFGGGHVGSELCPVLEHVGFEVWVLDDREEYASESLHPKASKCLLCDYGDVSKSVTIADADYVVIMTHGHAGDRDILLQACRSRATYIGCIGSRKKIEMTRAYLRDNGIPEERILQVHSPIGLPIGGPNPEEIAISVAAEIIMNRYK